jgi:hypothetical protein
MKFALAVITLLLIVADLLCFLLHWKTRKIIWLIAGIALWFIGAIAFFALILFR